MNDDMGIVRKCDNCNEIERIYERCTSDMNPVYSVDIRLTAKGADGRTHARYICAHCLGRLGMCPPIHTTDYWGER